MKDDWGREWRSANSAYGSSTFISACLSIYHFFNIMSREIKVRVDSLVPNDDDGGSRPGKLGGSEYLGRV